MRRRGAWTEIAARGLRSSSLNSAHDRRPSRSSSFPRRSIVIEKAAQVI
jgi:hypothetical protein